MHRALITVAAVGLTGSATLADDYVFRYEIAELGTESADSSSVLVGARLDPLPLHPTAGSDIGSSQIAGPGQITLAPGDVIRLEVLAAADHELFVDGSPFHAITTIRFRLRCLSGAPQLGYLPSPAIASDLAPSNVAQTATANFDSHSGGGFFEFGITGHLNNTPAVSCPYTFRRWTATTTIPANWDVGESEWAFDFAEVLVTQPTWVVPEAIRLDSDACVGDTTGDALVTIHDLLRYLEDFFAECP